MSDPAQTDALAAEYVLGTLDFDERTQAQALLVIDQEFVAKVRLWERRLGELHLMVEPVEPEGRIWERIKAKMPPPPPKPEVQPEPAVEPPASSAPSDAEVSGAEAKPVAAPEPTPAAPSLAEPDAIGLPVAPTIPSPASLVADLSPSVTPGVLPGAVAGPDASLPSSMARPLPSPVPDSPPSFLSKPLPPSPVAGSAPASAAAAVLAPSLPEPPAIARQYRASSGPGWRVLAVLMTLVVVAFGGLIGAWRFAPEHVPPMLHPVALMRSVGIAVNAGPPARRPAPPESQFDE